VTGSGTLAAGKYTSYDWENGNNPILETYLSANAITVVSPSCTILSGKNMNVDVGTIKRSDLKGVGTTAGGKDFNIELQCSGGLSESGYANIQTSFSGTLATSTTVSRGAAERKSRLLVGERNWYPGSEGGRTAGIQQEIQRRYAAQSGNPIHHPASACAFYQYAPTTSTGEVESHMIFNLTYD
jgi:hypothetical protein